MATPTMALEHVTALDRGLRVLQTFSRDHPTLTLSEMAALTKLAPATARRALHTLEALGYVTRLGRRFVLGPRVLGIAAGYLGAINADFVLLPFLTQLVAEVGGGSSVTILDQCDIICVAHAHDGQSWRLACRIGVGSRLPAYATAMGRVLLAFQPEAVVNECFSSTRLRKLTEFTEIEPEALRRILEGVRCLRFAVTQDELDYGFVSVAIPIVGPSGSVIAAVSCADIDNRYNSDALVNERLARLRRAGQRIEEALQRYPELALSIGAGTVLQGGARRGLRAQHTLPSRSPVSELATATVPYTSQQS
jgi:IclR family transcriptional regulator, pca regulon regulatory protein